MNLKIIRNDFKKNKLITLATILFVAAAAMLVSLVAILSVALTGAIDSLMQQAKTPHFLQMHSGDIDWASLEDFTQQRDDVAAYQTLEFLNIDNTKIQFGDGPLNSTQDNGFSTQSGDFDYLLDLDGNIIHVNDGELYVPICYMRDNTTHVGDSATISGKMFTVAGFLRDSQMNAMLSSSKRFLVSENDYAAIRPLGNVEYLIEFRLNDMSGLSAFEAAYTTASLPANGPTITYPLIKLLSAMSDGIMIGVILLVSLLVVAIALMCIWFTLLAKIEDDYREIGVMKAIGLRVSDIKRIYLQKYAAIAIIGCALGYALSFAFKGALTENIRLTLGEGGNSSLGGVFGLACVVLIFGVILAFVSCTLRRFRKISAAQAIRFGVSGEKHAATQWLTLSKKRWLNTNIFLGIKDVVSRKGLYVTMLVVLVLAAFIMIVPQNLYSTISADDFATYMGIGQCDMRIDVQQTEHIEGKVADIAQEISGDKTIQRSTILTTKAFNARLDDESVGIKIELGDHSTFPVSYAQGTAPTSPNDIALSSINADELGKSVSDRITIVTTSGDKTLTVCGVYSDITNGGKTAKATFDDSSTDTMWCIIYAELVDGIDVHSTADRYAQLFDFAKVTDTQAFIQQTYGQTLGAVKQASVAAVVVALGIMILVTLLFMKMVTAKDRYSIAVMKACGFTNADIRWQYVARAIFVSMVGIILGTILANTLGELLCGMVISSFGASAFRFTINPLWAYLLSPVIMVFAVLTATFLGTKSAGQINISQSIKE